MLDPASVVDHEARQMQWAELFNEALKSYRDLSAAAVVVSCRVGCVCGGARRKISCTCAGR